MTGVLTTYFSDASFRIQQRPPHIEAFSPQQQPAVEEVYLAIQQIIATFIDNCGISSKAPSDWVQIAAQAQAATVLVANMSRVYAVLTENIATGELSQLFLSGGLLKARKANATTNAKWCNCYCSYGAANGAVSEFILSRGVLVTAGLTVGARYFLDAAVSGALTAVPPVAAGNIEQYVGFALSTTELYVDIQGALIQH